MIEVKMNWRKSIKRGIGAGILCTLFCFIIEYILTVNFPRYGFPKDYLTGVLVGTFVGNSVVYTLIFRQFFKNKEKIEECKDFMKLNRRLFEKTTSFNRR